MGVFENCLVLDTPNFLNVLKDQHDEEEEGEVLRRKKKKTRNKNQFSAHTKTRIEKFLQVKKRFGFTAKNTLQ